MADPKNDPGGIDGHKKQCKPTQGDNVQPGARAANPFPMPVRKITSEQADVARQDGGDSSDRDQWAIRVHVPQTRALWSIVREQRHAHVCQSTGQPTGAYGERSSRNASEIADSLNDRQSDEDDQT